MLLQRNGGIMSISTYSQMVAEQDAMIIRYVKRFNDRFGGSNLTEGI